MATEADFIPWPNLEGRLLREQAVALAEKAKTLTGEIQLSRTTSRMTFSGKTQVAETDWMELARLLTKLGVDLASAGVPGSPLVVRSAMLSELRPPPVQDTAPAPILKPTLRPRD